MISKNSPNWEKKNLLNFTLSTIKFHNRLHANIGCLEHDDCNNEETKKIKDIQMEPTYKKCELKAMNRLVCLGPFNIVNEDDLTLPPNLTNVDIEIRKSVANCTRNVIDR